MMLNLQEAQARFEFLPSISVEEIYDDNVFLLNDGMKREDDFITQVTPGLSARYNLKGMDLSADYRAVLEFYSQFDEINSTDNQSGDLNLNYRVTKDMQFTMSDSLRFIPAENQLIRNLDPLNLSYVEREENVEISADAAIDNILTSTSSDILTNTAGSALSYAVSPFLSVTAEYNNIITEYDSPVFSDSIEHNIGLESNYRLNTFDTVNVVGSYRKFSFDTDEQEETYSGEGGLSHLFSPTMSGSISGGIIYFGEGNIDWVGRINFNKRLKHGNITTGYERTVTPTRGSSGTSMTQSSYIIFSQTLSSRLNYELTARYVNSESGRTGEVAGTDTLSYSINVNRLIAKRIRGSVNYSYTHQDYYRNTRGIINLHQFRIVADYDWKRWLNVGLSYSYFYRNITIEQWPIQDNRIVLRMGVLW